MNTTLPSLLEKVRDKRDGAAWKRLVDLYTPFLLYLARHWRLNGTEANDLVQDVFAKLVQELPKFNYDREKGRFRGWLRTLCFHCSLCSEHPKRS